MSPVPRFYCLLSFLCALCASVVSLSTVHGSRITSHDVLIYGAGLTPRGLNPLLDRNEWNEVSSVILSRLFRVDHEGRIVGDLVESYTVSDDGLTYTLELRQNLRWHDGTPCTADDVLFTWQKLFDPATQTSLDLNQPMLRDFAATGERTFVFHLRYPDAGFLAPLTEIAILPAHLLRGADINGDAFDRNPIGTGPYKLLSRAVLAAGGFVGQGFSPARGLGSLVLGGWPRSAGRVGALPLQFVLERHEGYHFGTPRIARLILRVIPDDDARAEALARGEVHLAQVKPQHVARLRELENVRVYRMRTGAWRGMPLNLRRPALQDVRVRRAIDLALDREAIVAKTLGGFGQPAYSPIPPASWAFDPAMNRRRYDPARSARLLDEAGWRLPPKPAGQSAGFWRERAGKVFELHVIVWKDEIFRRTAAELLREQLGALGIRVVLHPVDNATYNRLAENLGSDYDTFIGGWGGLLDPGDNLGKKFHSRGSQNYTGYSNPQVDRLLAQVRALPPQKRAEAKQLYRRLVELLTADAVFLPLAYPDYLFAADARLSLGPHGESGSAPLAGPPLLDSWYEFTKFAHQWSWVPGASTLDDGLPSESKSPTWPEDFDSLAAIRTALDETTPGPAKEEPQAWKQVAAVLYDWDRDGKPEKFILEQPQDGELNPGEATRLRIQFADRKEFVLRNDLVWIKYRSETFPHFQSFKNLLDSDYLLFLPFSRDPAKPPLLFLVGYPYGSSPGTLHAIALVRRWPRVVFVRNEFLLTKYADLDGDGYEELIGHPCFAQGWGCDLLTYCPFNVYKLPKEGGRAVLSLPLTKQYNLDYYYGWAGPNYSEKFDVVLHPPGGGKPVIMKEEDAKKVCEELYRKKE